MSGFALPTGLLKSLQTKPGFLRKRASGLADSELRKLFEAFCYFSRQQHRLVFNRESMGATLSKALRATALATGTELFIEDITKTACLMLEKGFEYHFIHKSVAEFHAAAFIARSSEEVARKFYAGVKNSKTWMEWRQEFCFLAEIDRFRYLKHYFVPAVSQDLNELGFKIASSLPVQDWEAAKHALNKIAVSGGRQKNRKGDTQPLAFTFGTAYSALGQDAFVSLMSLKGDAPSLNMRVAGAAKLGDLIEILGLQEAVVRRVRELSEKLHGEVIRAQAEIEQEACTLELIDPDELGTGTERKNRRSGFVRIVAPVSIND